MKRALLLAGAMVAAVPACAQWVLYSEGENSGKWFFDKSTVRVSGQMRRMWVLNSKSKPDKEGDRSARAFYEVDCEEQRVRTLQLTFYKGEMGGGQSGFRRNTPSEWEYAAPDTVGADTVAIACKP